MSAVERLIKTLSDRKLRVLPGREEGQLLLSGPDAEKTPAIIEAVKAYKTQLLEYVLSGKPEPVREETNDGEIQCGKCKRRIYCTMDEAREEAKSPHWCDRSQCPFRTTNNRNG